MTPTAAPERRSSSSLDTTQTSCTHGSDVAWAHNFRYRVADHVKKRWAKRAARIRRCGEAAVTMIHECGAPHFFPERCAARTCPVCAPRAAAAIADRLTERIRAHDLAMESEPWDGPGEAPRTAIGDLHGRAWMLLTLTTPAREDEADRFHPDTLRQDVRLVRDAFPGFWRRTTWGGQVRDPESRNKRARRDTSAVTAIEVAPGGMVHMHVLVYGEFVLQKLLAEEWARAIGLDGPAVVDIRFVRGDVAGGIREALKYATKGEGSLREQARKAAAVEIALANVKRVTILGALRRIKGRSEKTDSEDVQADDLHDTHEAACEACGEIGGKWQRGPSASAAAVTRNGGWGLVRGPP